MPNTEKGFIKLVNIKIEGSRLGFLFGRPLKITVAGYNTVKGWEYLKPFHMWALDAVELFGDSPEDKEIVEKARREFNG